jgi:hypothetical protein
LFKIFKKVEKVANAYLYFKVFKERVSQILSFLVQEEIFNAHLNFSKNDIKWLLVSFFSQNIFFTTCGRKWKSILRGMWWHFKQIFV